MTDVWRIAETKTLKGMARGQDFLDGMFISAGWSIDDEDVRNGIKTFEDYVKAIYAEVYEKTKLSKLDSRHAYAPFISGIMSESERPTQYFVKPGDYIWMLHHGDKATGRNEQWYVTRVTEEYHFKFDASPSAKYGTGNDDAARLMVERWQSVSDAPLPGHIEAPLMRGFTLRRLTTNEDAKQVLDISEHYFNNPEKAFELNLDQLTAEEYLGYLGSTGLEDLFYYYVHFRDDLQYEIIPSTDKESTPTYEYAMVSKQYVERKIGVQVKNGGNVDLFISDYAGDLVADYAEVWLITRNGRIFYKRDKKIKNRGLVESNFIRVNKDGIIESHSLDELFDFTKKQENRWLLPIYMQKWTR